MNGKKKGGIFFVSIVVTEISDDLANLDIQIISLRIQTFYKNFTARLQISGPIKRK